MAQRTFLIASALVLGCGLAHPVLAETTPFIYPLDSWHVSTQQGDEVGDGLYHMGIDAGFDEPAGSPVYAVADGVVKEAQERTQFGLVVLIEHQPTNEEANVSLYGHLDPTEILVSPGQTVQAGDVIGVLGDETNNGGWSVHIHFGIHKGAYTGEWVYYGHVRNPETANDWHDPETYLPEHLTTDNWNPTVTLDLLDEAIVGNTIQFTGTVGDVGSMVSKLRIKLSQDGEHWETLSLLDDPSYTLDQTLGISAYADGVLYVKLIARDHFNHKTTVQREVFKDPERYTLPAFVAMKSGKSDGFITQWSFGGTALQAFFPFAEDWDKGALLAQADDTIIAVRRHKRDRRAMVKVFTEAGTEQQRFNLPTGTKPIAVSADAETLTIGTNDPTAQVLSYSFTGELQWSLAAIETDFTLTDLAYADGLLYLCGESNNQSRLIIYDTVQATITKTLRPFSRQANTGCTITVGATILVGSSGNYPGTVRQFSLTGERLDGAFRPFGDEFTGQVDVSLVQWDRDATDLPADDLLVSQASQGQAWVKVYQFDQLSVTEPTVAFNQRIYEASFKKGTRIVGWQ